MKGEHMSEDNTGVTVTLKAGVGFEAPWIVIHASDVTDALKQVDTGDFASLAERTVAAAEFFRAAHAGRKAFPKAVSEAQAEPVSSGPGWSQRGSQQSAPDPLAQQGKACVHGAMVFREGTSAKGPWKAYFCPTAKGTPGQCPPEFLPR